MVKKGRKRVRGRQESPERVEDAGEREEVLRNPPRKDAASVKTAKSQQAVQREKILGIEEEMTKIEDEIAQLEITQRADIAELQKKKEESQFRSERLKEEFNNMDRKDRNYKTKRLEVVDAEFEAKKLRWELERVQADQAAEKRILENKLKSFCRKVENEKFQLDEIVVEENRAKDVGLPSVNSAEKRKQTEAWVNDILNDVHEDEREKTPSVKEVSRKLDKPEENPLAAFSSEKTLCKLLARQSIGRDFPTFAGESERWPRFKMEFVRISEECGFSDAEKMSKLEKCLKGEALRSVQSLMTAPGNVKRVMTRLEQLFGKTDLVINALIDKVRRTQAIRENNLEAFVDFGISVGSLTATIEALGDEAYLSNPYLVRELEEKLPRDFRLRWSDWIDGDTDRKKTLQCFTEWMDIQTAKVRDLCQPLLSSGTSDRRKDSKGKKTEFVNVTTDSKHKPDFKKKSTCNVCSKEGHWANQCRTFQNKSVEDRKKICEEKRLCLSCLIPGHRMSDCRRKKACGVNGCKDSHHQLLHRPAAANAPTQDQQQQEVSNSVVEMQNQVSTTSGVIMGALPVIIKGPKGSVKCLAFLDNGSSVSLIDEEVAQVTGLIGEKVSFCMKTMTSLKEFSESRRVEATISGDWENAKAYNIEGLRTVDELPLANIKQNGEELKKKWPYLSKLPIPSFNERPKLLIGNGHCFLTATRQMVGTAAKQPMAFKCRLGWSIGGQQSDSALGHETCFHICEGERSDEILHQMVKKSFSTEDFGVKVPVDKPRSREDLRALEIMKKTTVRVEGGDRFQTGLLWKNPDIVLPESKKRAIQRLSCQERKMDRDPEYAAWYCGKMKEYEEKGFIRKLDKAEIPTKSKRLWYLSHFGVVNPNKPGKRRLCFDAAEQIQGVSLNSVLSMGPDLNNPLVSVLWNFRKHQVAVVGDIKDMFHRVYMQPEDRVSQRFLWRGLRRDIEPEEYEMMVMVFGSTCSPSSAQFTKNLNAEEHAKEFPEAAQAIITRFYVDDFLYCAANVDEAKKMVKEVIHIMARGGFEICNFVSNSKEVMQSIPVELRSKSMTEVDLEKDDLPTGRVLGIWWNPTTDEFTFKLIMHKVPVEIIQQTRRPTKREILKVVMSVYDPLGFLGHLVVKGKIIQQDVWRSGIGWDDELPSSLNERWNSWMEELRGIETVRIPRCYSRDISLATKTWMHVFCDASEKAFSAVAFLRIESSLGIEVSLVSSKTRVTPLKPLSIPRLELQAALMATRLSNCIMEELEVEINQVTFWTDSMTVLRWIRSDARAFKPFIAHRLGEILETTEVPQWRYIPTKMNVADDATRDSEPADLSRDSRWFRGPSFLREDSATWPEDIDLQKEEFSDNDLEIKVSSVNVVSEKCYLVDVNRWSNYQKLLRTVAYVFRFVNRLRNKVSVSDIYLSVLEIRSAENFLVKSMQEEMFPDELRVLNGGKALEKKNRLYRLEPYLCSEGLIRVNGRLERSSNCVDFRHPVILDPKHHFTTLVLEWYHRMCGHQGHRTVANEVRQKFWILDGMSAIRKVFRSCVSCQKKNSKPVEVKMSDLPEFRVNVQLRPFQHTGIDYFGPIIIKIGRRNEKRWGVIFTCLTTRAVHLELVPSLATDSTMMVIQRFSSRRGSPSYLHSDNGTNFHGACNELKELLKEVNHQDVAERCALKGIQWNFNPPSAPHMGGAWERLVLSVKKTMGGILKDVHPTEETLHTVLLEVESILNSRPLTDVSVDPADPVCLTPNHFLLGWTGGIEAKEVQQPVWSQLEDNSLYLQKKWRFAVHLADQFWIRWKKEYLPTLTQRKKWIENGTEVKVGDIVIVVEDVGVRSRWPLGRITAVYPGKDGITRVVDVKTAAGIYRRPVAKICRLNIQNEDEVPSSGGRM